MAYFDSVKKNRDPLRVLALIPARGGSKRVPGKNLRPIGGKPLIKWTIDLALELKDICEVMVSTDDSEISRVAIDSGAMVPWLRPDFLATDEAKSIDVVIHALDWYETHFEKVDGLLLLQPTSPFRKLDVTQKGVELFKANNGNSIIGVSPSSSHPNWTFKLKDEFLSPIINESKIITRSQDLPAVYTVNGSFYLAAPEDLRKNNSFVASNSMPLITTSPEEALDIDTIWDFELAQFLFSKLSKNLN